MTIFIQKCRPDVVAFFTLKALIMVLILVWELRFNLRASAVVVTKGLNVQKIFAPWTPRSPAAVPGLHVTTVSSLQV